MFHGNLFNNSYNLFLIFFFLSAFFLLNLKAWQQKVKKINKIFCLINITKTTKKNKKNNNNLKYWKNLAAAALFTMKFKKTNIFMKYFIGQMLLTLAIRSGFQDHEFS